MYGSEEGVKDLPGCMANPITKIRSELLYRFSLTLTRSILWKAVFDESRINKSTIGFTSKNKTIQKRPGRNMAFKLSSELVCRHMDPYISIGKESIEGESDDIFFETNKKEKKEKTEIMIN
ncbi:hypothetical protein ACJX0J_001044 [Zea mays]